MPGVLAGAIPASALFAFCQGPPPDQSSGHSAARSTAQKEGGREEGWLFPREQGRGTHDFAGGREGWQWGLRVAGVTDLQGSWQGRGGSGMWLASLPGKPPFRGGLQRQPSSRSIFALPPPGYDPKVGLTTCPWWRGPLWLVPHPGTKRVVTALPPRVCGSAWFLLVWGAWLRSWVQVLLAAAGVVEDGPQALAPHPHPSRGS